MHEHFWQSSASSIRKSKKENKTTLENSYGSVEFQAEKDSMRIELSRKSEYEEPVFAQNREKLEEGHLFRKKTPFGTYTVDSQNKETSAFRYEEKESRPEERVFASLAQLKKTIYNESLFKLLPPEERMARYLFLTMKASRAEDMEEEIVSTFFQKMKQTASTMPVEEGMEEAQEEGKEEEN